MKFFFTIILILSIKIKIYSQDGSIDPTFNVGSGFNGAVYDIKVLPDNKLIAVGTFTSYKGITCNRIIKLNTDGSIDTTFKTGTGLDNWAYALAIQNDGKIIIAGNFSTYNDTLIGARIARLNPNGSIDQTFNTGNGFGNNVFALKIQNDGKIIAGGQFQNYDTSIVENIVRINPNGSIDNTFNIGTGFSGINTFVRCLSIDENNKILVGGTFNIYNGNSVNNIVRLNNDGSYDSSFSIGMGFNSYVLDIFPYSNKYLITGDFTNYNGNNANRIINLNNDGSIDNTFIYGTGFNAVSGTILKQTDNKFLISGLFSSYNGINTGNIIRLNSNGSIDNTFSTINTNFNQGTNICIQHDNKIIAYGNFTSPTNRIVRLNNTFNSIQEETFRKLKFRIFPNPAKSLITINNDNETVQEFELHLYDFCGKQFLNKKILVGNNLSEQINTDNFTQGMYFIKLKNFEEEYIYKIIIE